MEALVLVPHMRTPSTVRSKYQVPLTCLCLLAYIYITLPTTTTTYYYHLLRPPSTPWTLAVIPLVFSCFRTFVRFCPLFTLILLLLLFSFSPLSFSFMSFPSKQPLPRLVVFLILARTSFI